MPDFSSKLWSWLLTFQDHGKHPDCNVLKHFLIKTRIQLHQIFIDVLELMIRRGDICNQWDWELQYSDSGLGMMICRLQLFICYRVICIWQRSHSHCPSPHKNKHSLPLTLWVCFTMLRTRADESIVGWVSCSHAQWLGRSICSALYESWFPYELWIILFLPHNDLLREWEIKKKVYRAG